MATSDTGCHARTVERRLPLALGRTQAEPAEGANPSAIGLLRVPVAGEYVHVHARAMALTATWRRTGLRRTAAMSRLTAAAAGSTTCRLTRALSLPSGLRKRGNFSSVDVQLQPVHSSSNTT